MSDPARKPIDAFDFQLLNLDSALPIYSYMRQSAALNYLLLPALGTRVSYYAPFALALAEKGANVFLLEQRGHGKSPIRASRSHDYGYRDLATDAQLAIQWISAQNSLPCFIAGHSLGGHIALLAALEIPNQITGLHLLASCKPYYRHFKPLQQYGIRLGNALFPVLTGLYGYYPGNLMGFGEREGKSMMRDWLRLAAQNSFDLPSYSRDLVGELERLNIHVLSHGFQDDEMAPEAAIQALNAHIPSAQVDYHSFSEEDLGCRADHFKWARKDSSLQEQLWEWMQSRIRP
jgi:predicted alpha/beta hydrolase